MKLGELIVELGTKGNTKELEKTLKQLKEAEKKISAQIKLNKDLAKATTDEEKSLIKKNHALKEEINATEKIINKNKERNKTIVEGIKGFTRLIGVISLAVGVMDRFANASAKTNQNILTMSQVSGVNVNTLNKYASAARSTNYNATREEVAQAFQSITQHLIGQRMGEDFALSEGLKFLVQYGSKGDLSKLPLVGSDPTKFMELLREYIKGVDDTYVAQALAQMGISSNLIPMLRMSQGEFGSVKNRFLSEDQMRQEQKRSLELQEKRDELSKTFEKTLIDIYPALEEIAKDLVILAPVLADILKNVTPILTEIAKLLRPIFEAIGGIYKWLKKPIERKDLEWADKTGKKVRNSELSKKAVKEAKNILNSTIPLFGAVSLISGINDSIIKNATETATRLRAVDRNNITMNTTYNNTINTTQPADQATLNNINRGEQYKEANLMINRRTGK